MSKHETDSESDQDIDFGQHLVNNGWFNKYKVVSTTKPTNRKEVKGFLKYIGIYNTKTSDCVLKDVSFEIRVPVDFDKNDISFVEERFYVWILNPKHVVQYYKEISNRSNFFEHLAECGVPEKVARDMFIELVEYSNSHYENKDDEDEDESEKRFLTKNTTMKIFKGKEKVPDVKPISQAKAKKHYMSLRDEREKEILKAEQKAEEKEELKEANAAIEPDFDYSIECDEYLQHFLHKFQPLMSEYNAVIMGSTPAFLINKEIGIPNDIDIWINAHEERIDIFIRKFGWEIKSVSTPAGNNISPNIKCIWYLEKKEELMKVQVIRMNIDFVQMSNQFDLTPAKSIWNPRILPGDIEPIGLGATEPFVYKAVLEKKAYFVPRSWDLITDFKGNLVLTKRSVWRLRKYKIKGFEIIGGEMFSTEVLENFMNDADYKIDRVVMKRGTVPFFPELLGFYYIENEFLQKPKAFIEYKKYPNLEMIALSFKIRESYGRDILEFYSPCKHYANHHYYELVDTKEFTKIRTNIEEM